MTETKTTKIAVPTDPGGNLEQHFGHCDRFTFLEVDAASGEILSEETATPPPHEPGVLPRWLAEQNVGQVIAGGMGMRARQLFVQAGIGLTVGAGPGPVRSIVEAHLSGTLQTGNNPCDH